MNMTNDEYRRYAERHAPRSRVGRNCLGAFLVGGAICCLGQPIFALWQAAGLNEEAAGTAQAFTLVALGSADHPRRIRRSACSDSSGGLRPLRQAGRVYIEEGKNCKNIMI